MKKTYVLDTNVFLTDAKSIFSFNNNDIVIPLKVLEEIDKHKKRQDGVGLNARSTIRILDSLRSKGNLHKGVRVAKGKGVLSVRGYDLEDLPAACDLQSADNEIITTAITEKKKNIKRKDERQFYNPVPNGSAIRRVFHERRATVRATLLQSTRRVRDRRHARGVLWVFET